MLENLTPTLEDFELAEKLKGCNLLPDYIRANASSIAIFLCYSRYKNENILDIISEVGFFNNRPFWSAARRQMLLYNSPNFVSSEILESDETHCKLTVTRKYANATITHEVSYTIDEARKAGYIKNSDKNHGWQSTWEREPKLMLIHTARRKAIALYFPEVLMSGGGDEPCDDIFNKDENDNNEISYKNVQELAAKEIAKNIGLKQEDPNLIPDFFWPQIGNLSKSLRNISNVTEEELINFRAKILGNEIYGEKISLCQDAEKLRDLTTALSALNKIYKAEKELLNKKGWSLQHLYNYEQTLLGEEKGTFITCYNVKILDEASVKIDERVASEKDAKIDALGNRKEEAKPINKSNSKEVEAKYTVKEALAESPIKEVKAEQVVVAPIKQNPDILLYADDEDVADYNEVKCAEYLALAINNYMQTSLFPELQKLDVLDNPDCNFSTLSEQMLLAQSIILTKDNSWESYLKKFDNEEKFVKNISLMLTYCQKNVIKGKKLPVALSIGGFSNKSFKLTLPQLAAIMATITEIHKSQVGVTIERKRNEDE